MKFIYIFVSMLIHNNLKASSDQFFSTKLDAEFESVSVKSNVNGIPKWFTIVFKNDQISEGRKYRKLSIQINSSTNDLGKVYRQINEFFSYGMKPNLIRATCDDSGIQYYSSTKSIILKFDANESVSKCKHFQIFGNKVY